MTQRCDTLNWPYANAASKQRVELTCIWSALRMLAFAAWREQNWRSCPLGTPRIQQNCGPFMTRRLYHGGTGRTFLLRDFVAPSAREMLCFARRSSFSLIRSDSTAPVREDGTKDKLCSAFDREIIRVCDRLAI